MENIAFPVMLAGDVVLFRGRGLSRLLEIAQGLARFRWSGDTCSHAAFGISTGLLIHAVKGSGVCVASAFTELSGLPLGSWRAYRNLRLLERHDAGFPETGVLVGDLAEFYLGQRYKITSPGRQRDDTAFCSQLVGRVYEAIGLPFSKPSDALWPIDIARDVNGTEWVDVTVQWLAILLGSGEYAALRAKYLAQSQALKSGIELVRDVHVEVENGLQLYRSRFGAPPHGLSSGKTYWDTTGSGDRGSG